MRKVKGWTYTISGSKDRNPHHILAGYVGTQENNRVIEQGSWTIQHGVKGYPEADVIALDKNYVEELRYFWRVNDDVLLLLDNALKPKVGDAASGYMLSIYDEPYGPRVYEISISD
jgi:hypothetical protein